MSDAEAIMWAVEKDPALRSDFCNLTVLDRRPADARLRATLERALEAIPRLRQRVIGAPLRLVPPAFADDPTLDVETHVRVVGVPAPGDMRALLDVCGGFAEQPLDRARPLWEFTLLEGLEDGRAALLQKVHHTITDGVGGLRLSLALVDFERDPEPATAAAAADAEEREAAPATPLDVARRAVADATGRNLHAARRVLDEAVTTVAHPGAVPQRVVGAARQLDALRRETLVTEQARSDVMTARSLRRRFEVAALPLERMRTVATKLDGTVNDAFVTGLASALGTYHERRASAVTELRMAMAISTRGRGDRGTNRFVPTRVLVPLQPAHDLPVLFAAVHDRLERAKTAAARTRADALAGLVSGLPTSVLVALTRSQTRTVDFAASNMRGSPVPLYLAGSRILANYPFGPRTGCALNVTMLSYCDELHLGMNVDPAAITDVAELRQDIDDAFEALLAQF